MRAFLKKEDRVADGSAGRSVRSEGAEMTTGLNQPGNQRGTPSAPNPGSSPGALGGASSLTGTEAKPDAGSQRPPLMTTSQSSAADSFNCRKCGKSFAQKAGCQRHERDCGLNARRKCNHCSMTFASFPAVRQHERRTHPEAYRKELEEKLPASTVSIMTTLADIEASCRGGKVSLDQMTRATGLTVHQVRSRRESDEYAWYLEAAKKRQRERALNIFKPGAAPPPRTAPVAGTSRSLPSAAPAGQTVRTGPQPCVSGATAPPRPPLPAGSRAAIHGGAVPRIRIASEGAASREVDLPRIPAETTAPTKRRPSSSPKGKPSARRARLLSAPCAGRQPPSTAGRPTVAVSTGDARARPITEKRKRLSPAEPPQRRRPEPGERCSTPLAATTVSVAGPSATPTGPAPMPRVADPERSQVRPPSHAPTAIPPVAGSNPPIGGGGEVRRDSFQEWLVGAQSHDLGEATSSLITEALCGSTADLDASLTDWLAAVFPSRNRPSAPARPAPPPVHSTGRRRRAAEYKKAQDLFRKNRPLLVEHVLGGKPLLEPEAHPPIAEVDALYRGIFEGGSTKPDRDPYTPRSSRPVYYPITEDEITRAVSTWRNAAPGPDGITIPQVKRCPARLLAVLFNVVLYRQFTPTVWKSSRTVLIHKGGDRRDPTNWRPITIGAAPQRLLHRILAGRLSKALDLDERQRGFREIDGTLANILLVDHYIRSRRAAGRAFNVVSLDVKKAFDSVLRSAVERALRRAGVEEELIIYIMSTLDADTIITVGGQATAPIRFTRGLKQGDPLSPPLFNLVVDELLGELNSQRPGGTIAPGIRCAALGFADDIVLMEDREVDMGVTLGITETFLAARGMVLNPGKSVAIMAASVKGVSVPRTKASFRVSGGVIRCVADMSPFRYLGLQFTSHGALKPGINNLTVWLRNLQRSPLKPDQKYVILKNHLVPRLFYGLQTPAVTGAVLAECTRLCRKAARKMLHLSEHTGNQLVHAAIRDGGLGLTDMRHKVPVVMKRRLDRLVAEDELLAAAVREEPLSRFRQRLDRLADRGDPAPYWREQIAAHAMSAGLEGAVDDAASRAWLARPPSGWTGRDFVRAVQLRTANLACRALPWVTGNARSCRGCDSRVETLSHVLQACRVSHHDRIKRHDEVVRKIASHTRRKGWVTDVEPHVRHQDGRLYKPDLAVHLADRRVVICDVSVCWEGQRSLAESWDNKRLVYDHAHFRDAASRLWPGQDVVCLPVILGARGIWPRANAVTSDTLAFTRTLRASCVNGVLRWGSTIHRNFMAGVWKRRPPDPTTRLGDGPAQRTERRPTIASAPGPTSSRRRPR